MYVLYNNNTRDNKGKKGGGRQSSHFVNSSRVKYTCCCCRRSYDANFAFVRILHFSRINNRAENWKNFGCRTSAAGLYCNACNGIIKLSFKLAASPREKLTNASFTRSPHFREMNYYSFMWNLHLGLLSIFGVFELKRASWERARVVLYTFLRNKIDTSLEMLVFHTVHCTRDGIIFENIDPAYREWIWIKYENFEKHFQLTRRTRGFYHSCVEQRVPNFPMQQALFIYEFYTW